MGKVERLIARMRVSPNNIRFGEIVRLLTRLGCVQRAQKGTSHRLYSHPKHPAVLLNLQSDGGRAKPYQVRQILSFFDEYLADDWSDDSEEDGAEAEGTEEGDNE